MSWLRHNNYIDSNNAETKKEIDMKNVAKIFFNAEASRNLDDYLWDVVVENNWNDFGSIKMDCLAKAEEVAKEIAIKNEVTASVTIYGTLNNGRFDRNNVVKTYDLG